MKKLAFASFLACLSMFLPSCENCKIQPDLIADLLAPFTDIIQGEIVDWPFIVKSIQMNQECESLLSPVSLAEIQISYFSNTADTTGALVFYELMRVGSLGEGDEQYLTSTIGIFDTVGIYMVKTTADITNVVTESNENNNTDIGEAELKIGLDLFENASAVFKKKLNEASALVIIGDFTNEQQPTHYKGKPIYYSK